MHWEITKFIWLPFFDTCFFVVVWNQTYKYLPKFMQVEDPVNVLNKAENLKIYIKLHTLIIFATFH